MLITKYNNIKIAGLSVAVPTQQLPVESFNDAFGKEVVANVSDMTGIKSLSRAIPEQTPSDLGFAAARGLIEKLNVDVNEIGILVFVTQKPDFRVPSTAFLLHKRLGLPKDCSCFDINLACQGFVFGLHTVMAMLKSSNKKKALLITGDSTVRTISPHDRTMMLLFGDSGSAALVEKTEESCPIEIILQTDGSYFKSVITPSGAYRNRNGSKERELWSDGILRSDYDTHMDGMGVFGFSITDVPKIIRSFLEEIGTSPEIYDCFALHQPNMYILNKIAKKIKIPIEKLLISLDRFGNNSSSSIPLVLSDHFGDQENEVIRTFMCGFGSGLSTGCADISIEAKVILPLIYTDEFYKEEILN